MGTPRRRAGTARPRPTASGSGPPNSPAPRPFYGTPGPAHLRARGTPTARAHRRHTGRGGAQPSCVRARHLPRGRTGSGAGAGARPVATPLPGAPARRGAPVRPAPRPAPRPAARQAACPTPGAKGSPALRHPARARLGPRMEHTRDTGPTTPGTLLAGAAELPVAHVMPVPASSRSEPGLQPRSGHPSSGAGGRASWHRNPARYRGSRPGAGPFPGGAGGVAAALVVPAARSLRSWQRRGRTDAGCPVDRTPGCPVDRTTPAGEAARCALAPGPATAHPESPS